MSDLKKAAQDALDALNHRLEGRGLNDLSLAVAHATQILRAALAIPEKTNQCAETCERAKLCAVCARGLEETKQEPVCDKDPRGCYSVRCQLGRKCKHTAPPRRKPLTEEALMALLPGAVRLPPGWKDFARAIEKAHGIL